MSGSVRKCTEMGRPLPSVSINGSSGYVTSSAAACTHVLSFACFKLSRNFSPIAVVDAAVSPPSSASVCTRRPCQQSSPSPFLSPSAPLRVYMGARRWSSWCCGGVEGQRRVKGGRSSNQVRRRALPIHGPQPCRLATISLNRPEPPPTPPHATVTTWVHVPAVSGASTADPRFPAQQRPSLCASQRSPCWEFVVA